MAQSLRDMGLFVAPSAGNFLFVDVGRPGAAVAEALLSRGVIIKPWKERGYEHFIRVTVGSERDNRQFLEGMHQVLEQPAG